MKRNGFTLIELLVSLTILLLGLAGFQMLFAAGIKTALKTNASAVVTQQNAQAIRRVVSTLNEAMSATITLSNTKVTYVLPKKSTTNDPITGQKEFIIPLETDGTTHYFQVTNGTLVDETGRVIVKSIVTTDLDPNSSQYNQTYAPFQFTTVGGTRAVTINLVTSMTVGTKRYAKMKSTVLLRNVQ